MSKADRAAGAVAAMSRGRATIGSYRVEQRHVVYHRRNFHFVSYETAPGMIGASPTWFLMSAGTRWEAVPELIGEEPESTDRRLVEWLKRTIA